MPLRTARLGCVVALSCAGVLSAAEMPKFSQIEAVVLDVAKRSGDYRPGDLVTRKQAEAMLDRIDGLGWSVAERGSLEKQVLADDSFLAKKLSTSGGKKFMRQIASLNLAYDRLDRLGQLPQGRNTVDRLIRGPDGYKLLAYMSSEKGGRELAKMLSKDGEGDFNQPTGKLYTVEQLLRELEARYEKAR